MKKKVSFIIGLSMIFLAFKGYGQDASVFAKLKNDLVSFRIFVAQWDEEKDEFFSRAYVCINSLDSADWVVLTSLSNKDWIKLLNNPQFDWGANLALYELYKKEAYFFKSIDTRSEWIRNQKENDIKYWTSRLNKK